MYKAWRKRILILLLPVFCYISTACQTHTQPRDDILRVAVTIPPLAEFVEQVGKEQVQITIMVPPGVSPHTYEPVPSQLALLASTDLYVKVGTPIEFELVWLDKLTAMNKTMHI
jgi:zinc transport system substrate-binding protein